MPSTRSRFFSHPRRLGLVLALIAGNFVASVGFATEAPRHFILEIDLAIERGGTVGVLFDFGDGIYGENSSVATVPPGATPHTVRLQLPAQPIRGLRFDPTADDQPVLITGLRLLDEQGRLLHRSDPRTLGPRHQIARIIPEGTGVRVVPEPRADDPMLRVDFAPLQKAMHEAAQRTTVGAGSIVFLAIALAALLALGVVGALRASDARGGWLGTLGLFLVVFGARLAWLNVYAKPVPFWDEWEGDALYILIPFRGGFLDWGTLVMPQWEHRILLTRTVTLFGTLLNGEWDTRVAMTVSAVMFAATIAVIGRALLATRHGLGVAAAAGLAAWAALPFDVNNLFWGGQTQMYGLVLTAVCVFAVAAAARLSPLLIAGGTAASAVSLFTMGAGPVAPGLAAGICLVRAGFEREQRRERLGLAAVFFATALIGVFLHVTSRQHVPLYAKSFGEFQRACVGVLAWPLAPSLVIAMLLWLPWIVNAILIARRHGGTPLEWLSLALGTWELINAVALGYARPYEGPPFDTRFFTPLSLGALGAVGSGIALALRAAGWRTRALPLAVVAAAIAGLVWSGVRGLDSARETGLARAELDHRLRLYLATGDRMPVIEKPPAFVGEGVLEKLDAPELQRILPAPYRRALAVRDPQAFIAPIEAGPITLAVRTLMKGGLALAIVGGLAFGWAARRALPRVTNAKNRCVISPAAELPSHSAALPSCSAARAAGLFSAPRNGCGPWRPAHT